MILNGNFISLSVDIKYVNVHISYSWVVIIRDQFSRHRILSIRNSPNFFVYALCMEIMDALQLVPYTYGRHKKAG